MAINEHPAIGTILICDFTGFKEPEMVKRRPVVVISPKIAIRGKLCTVVPISTGEPTPKMSYHCQLDIQPPLPEPYDQGPNWIKGDMVFSAGFHRLDLIRLGKDRYGQRIYRYDTLPHEDIKRVRSCVLASLGLGGLTKHLP